MSMMLDRIGVDGIEVAELRFRAMASEVLVIITLPNDERLRLEELALASISHLEQLWSRFTPSSEVSRINSAFGSPLTISPETVLLLSRMEQARQMTGGLFDPGIAAALDDAGFQPVPPVPGRASAQASLSAQRSAPASVSANRNETDDESNSPLADHYELVAQPLGVSIVGSIAFPPPGFAVDPGGIGKGLAADLVVTNLLAHGASGALVSIGGDLVAEGTPPTSGGWLIEVEGPVPHGSLLGTIDLDHGGVATSSVLSRTWPTEAGTAHHSIDPRTGAPSGTDLDSVTIIAGSGWEAEAHSTAALLGGSETFVDYLDRHGLSGIGQRRGLQPLVSGDLHFLVPTKMRVSA